MFSKGGELQATVGTTLHPPSLEASLSLSPVDHIGILAGFSWAPAGNDYEHTYGEVAIGGYLNPGNWRIELYGGAGYGTSFGPFGLGVNWADNIRWSGDFTRVFGQVDAGYVFSKYFELGALYRMGWLTAWVGGISQTSEWYQETKHQLTGEWGLVLRGGWTMVKIEWQVLIAARLDSNNASDTMGYIFASLLGLHLSFDLW